MNPLVDAEIQHRKARSSNSGILAIEAIAVDIAQPERSREPVPLCPGQSTVHDGMRSAVDVDSRQGPTIEGVGDFCNPAVESEITIDLQRSLGFKSISPARSLEFDAAGVGNIDLLIGAVDQEQVGAH